MVVQKVDYHLNAAATSDIGRFGIIPEWLLDTGVSDRAIRVYSILAAKFADRETQTSFPSRQTLATHANCSVDSIDRSLRELTKAGGIVIERRRKTSTEWDTSVYLVVYVRPGGRGSAATPSRIGAAENHNHVNHNQEPLNNIIWPDWFSLGYGLKGWVIDLETAEAWRIKNNYSEEYCLDQIYKVRGWWTKKHEKDGRNPYSTFQGACRENWAKTPSEGGTIRDANGRQASRGFGGHSQADTDEEYEIARQQERDQFARDHPEIFPPAVRQV